MSSPVPPLFLSLCSPQINVSIDFRYLIQVFTFLRLHLTFRWVIFFYCISKLTISVYKIQRRHKGRLKNFSVLMGHGFMLFLKHKTVIKSADNMICLQCCLCWERMFVLWHNEIIERKENILIPTLRELLTFIVLEWI